MTRRAIVKGRSEPIQGWSIDFEVRRLAYAGLVLLLLYSLGCPGATAQEPFEAANHAAPIKALHMYLVAAAISSLTTGFDPQPGIFNRFTGKDAQIRYTGVPAFGKIYAGAHSGINPVFNGNQCLFEPVLVLKPEGDPAKTLRLFGDPIRVFSKMSGWFTTYTEGHSNSWRQWPIRLLMASADQFQFSIPPRPHRSVERPVATTAAVHQ